MYQKYYGFTSFVLLFVAVSLLQAADKSAGEMFQKLTYGSSHIQYYREGSLTISNMRLNKSISVAVEGINLAQINTIVLEEDTLKKVLSEKLIIGPLMTTVLKYKCYHEGDVSEADNDSTVIEKRSQYEVVLVKPMLIVECDDMRSSVDLDQYYKKSYDLSIYIKEIDIEVELPISCDKEEELPSHFELSNSRARLFLRLSKTFPDNPLLKKYYSYFIHE